MNGLIVFAGPSVPPTIRNRWEGVDWRPPAEGGDILRLPNDVERLVLIDGYFEHRAAPFHKELLAVMASGVEVYGASSMGALRAAELWQQGMIGVGAIYEAYRSGRLTGDDEVALVHAPERLGWAPLSVPMVEVRASLVRAVRTCGVGVQVARQMREVAHAIHFVERDWPRLRMAWLQEGIGEGVIDLIETGHVPLKMMDAAIAIERALTEPRHDRIPNWEFPSTLFFERLQSAVRASAS